MRCRYRKSDLTFSEPLGNHLNLYQLELNPDDRLVFNFRAPQYDDVLLGENGESTSLLKDKVCARDQCASGFRSRETPVEFDDLQQSFVLSVA